MSLAFKFCRILFFFEDESGSLQILRLSEAQPEGNAALDVFSESLRFLPGQRSQLSRPGR